MTSAAVSVLVPLRAAAATLHRALGGVWRARGVAYEVVVVDHAADAATRAALARALDEGARRATGLVDARVVEAPASVGLGAALEIGRRACRAPFVARMDGDDVMHPARLAADVAALRAHASLAAIACRTKLVPKGRTSAGLRAYVAWQNAALTVDDHAREIWIEQPLCHPATTFRAGALDDVGGWRDGPFAEDYDLYLRLVARGAALAKRPDVHHAWREHGAMTTRTDPRYARDAFAALKARALIARFAVDRRPLVVAGAGKEGGRIGRALVAAGARIACYVDVDPAKIGRVRHGAPVVDASTLAAVRRAHEGPFVVAAVGTSGARGVVRAALADAGFVEGKDAVVVA